MTQVSHDPRQCLLALARTAGPVVLDLETTGLRRWNQIVSAGLLVDEIAYVLFARSTHVSVRNLPLPAFREALQPLERADLIVIAHNARFDLGLLLREGIRVGGEVHDTLKLLRLIDQDRGAEREGSTKRRPRRDLRAPEHAPMLLDYKLKHVAGQLLGLKMPHFPGSIALAPYDKHATYLTCDLVGTKALYDYLWPRLSDALRNYYQQMVAPLIPILLNMTEQGVVGDRNFITTETERMDRLMNTLAAEHELQHGMRLPMNGKQMREWLFRVLRLPVLKQQRQGRNWVPSLDKKVLRMLRDITEDARAIDSLNLIQDYRQVSSLIKLLRSLTKHIDRQTGYIHSGFDDRQSSGRISSTKPNLQQLANTKTIRGDEFRSRNALRASDGFELVAFDVAQADIRALAHAVESFPRTAREHMVELSRRRWELLGPAISTHYDQMQAQQNPEFVGQLPQIEAFDPAMPADLAEDFRRPGDFYTTVAARFLGRNPTDRAERNQYKETILSTVNGMGPPALARKLNCTEGEAKRFLADFETYYPKVAAFKRLMYQQIAWTGQTETFKGRSRTVTAHRWLVTEPRVELLVSYKRGDAYWLDVVPLRPSLRVLTAFVRRAWNARDGRLIYDAERGPLSRHPYSLFAYDALQYRLPIRNWGWRSIRRVRARGEEADYEGFDATARAAFNFICQGGTSDISKLMMLRSQPICKEFGARLLIQIHDELVFEVPKERAQEFPIKMKQVLEEPPVPGFAVPIIVEPKRGPAFGSLEAVPTGQA
jgi:DNA polymerase I-like protein with 3'-5' exonuclease and polymerase domains